jgi:hypothetical protein
MLLGNLRLHGSWGLSIQINDVYILACLSAKAQPFTTSNGFLRITHQFYCNLDNKCKVVFMVRPSLRLPVYLFKQVSFTDFLIRIMI